MKITAFNPKIGFLTEKKLVVSTDKPSLFLIGRHPNSDLVLNTPEVSRVHGSSNDYYLGVSPQEMGAFFNDGLTLEFSQMVVDIPTDNLSSDNFQV